MAAMPGWLRLARICALAVELRVGRLPDLAHAALAEEGGVNRTGNVGERMT